MSKEKLGPFSSNGKNARQVDEKKQEEKNPLQGVICTCSGDAIAPVYRRTYDKDLDANVVRKVDETNIFEFVQASKSTTDLATLQKRFIELGEIPNVNPEISYPDTAVMPHNIHELYNMVTDIDANFKKLPDSVQKVFGDSQTYLSALMDGSYNQKLVDAFTPKEPPKEEKPKEEKKGE